MTEGDLTSRESIGAAIGPDAEELYKSRAEAGQASFGEVIGLEYQVVRGDRVEVGLELKPHLHQPFGIVHGGVWCAIAEETASAGGAAWFSDRGHVVGVNNSTDFLRPRIEGRVTAVATPVQQGRTQQLWRIVITDEDDKIIAVSQVRLANIAS